MKNRKKFSCLLLVVIILFMFDGLLTNKSKAETSGTTPAVCQATMTGTTTIPKVTLTPKPLDLVFILDASGSFTSNMPKVKSMINSSIDKYVQPANGDRTMITTFQGVKDIIYQSPVGTNYSTNTIGDYKITTNSSKLTSDITSVKNFVNSVTPGGGTPTPSGVTQALNDYKSIAGAATGRQTVFVLITDGVVNVNPKSQNLEKNAALEQAYVDKFKSVSTFVGRYSDSTGKFYSQYQWARYDAVTGQFVRNEFLNDYSDSTTDDKIYNSNTNSWRNIYIYETSQDWKARLND
ncbi:VWA domain-containing protein [Macrococcus caseolyticus]|uniref:vWA domain-containing protein n=1 Tax=Macrococcoides caseolyticum TaxID=69966 RepID=UPI0024BCFA2F|nr:vWA domain-containing protein [Macrococcus caseolyticus]MDJ1156191.1 VWA domain-containing protein [Macrococcus caseolyticus]